MQPESGPSTPVFLLHDQLGRHDGPTSSDNGRADAFRGARFTRSDLSGATFRDCDLSGVRISGSWLDGLSVSGGYERLLVDDVDVTAFVATELDRRNPERVQVREMGTADDHRDVLDALLALAAVPGDQVLTSDPVDVAHLLGHRDIPVRVIAI